MLVVVESMRPMCCLVAVVATAQSRILYFELGRLSEQAASARTAKSFPVQRATFFWR